MAMCHLLMAMCHMLCHKIRGMPVEVCRFVTRSAVEEESFGKGLGQLQG